MPVQMTIKEDEKCDEIISNTFAYGKRATWILLVPHLEINFSLSLKMHWLEDAQRKQRGTSGKL